MAGADFIGAEAVGALGTEGPSTVGVDAVFEAVEVEAVRVGVRVKDMDTKAFAGLRVDDSSGDAAEVSGLIDVGQDELVDSTGL